MGYSGPAAPGPAVTCLPDDWWDPAWQAVQTPGATPLEPEVCQPGEPTVPAAGIAQSGAHPATPPPSWGQVLGTTLSLFAARHLPWLRPRSRRLSRSLPAALALVAGLAAVAVGTVGLTTTVLSPGPAVLIARPAPIPAPSGRSVLPASVATAPQPAQPVWVSIPAIGVRTSLIDLGVTKNGTLQVPASTAVAGWYTGSPRPGAVGSAIIAGHVDSRSGPGIFFWLRTVRPGERVYVGRADGTMAVFTITSVRMYAKDQFPSAAVYGAVPDAELRLITCGGVFDRSLGSYRSNVVVFARLAG